MRSSMRPARTRPRTPTVLRNVLAAAAVTCGLALAAGGSHAQVVADPGERVLTMQMLLERTFLKVDVLTLEVYVVGQAALDVERLATEDVESGPAADSIAAVVFNAPVAGARTRFLRGASLSQFVSEVRRSMRRAVDAGLLLRADADAIAANMPIWYGFLEERGIRPGDTQQYRISGDTLHTTYVDSDGRVLLDQIDVARASRDAVLGSYFAPRSDFRRPLLRSLRPPDQEPFSGVATDRHGGPDQEPFSGPAPGSHARALAVVRGAGGPYTRTAVLRRVTAHGESSDLTGMLCRE